MAGGLVYTDEEYDLIVRVVAEGGTNRDVHRAFEERWPGRRSYAALCRVRASPKVTDRIQEYREASVRRHLSGEAATGVQDERPEVEGPPPTTYKDPERLWERAKDETRRALEFEETRHEATLTFQQSRPIGVTFISDQHISEGGPVNLDRMEEDAAIVRETAGLHAVLGGDGVDNHLKHRQAMIASGSNPGREWQLYDHYLGMFGLSLAALCSGNHDDWAKDFSAVDMVGTLAKRHRVFYAPDFVVLTVRLTSPESEEPVDYVVKVRHQYRYSSSFNKTHTVKRLWEMDNDDFDIGVVCHQHEAAMEPFVKHGKIRLAFRPGSYQFVTGYSRRIGFPPAVPTCPTAILFPGTRHMIGFWDVREAASYLTYLRAGWPESGRLLGFTAEVA